MPVTPRRSCCVIFCLLIPSLCLAASKQKQAEQLTYKPPAGWDRTEQERIVVFTPPDVPPSKCALVVTPGEDLDGDFVKWFKTKWDALRKGAKVVQGGERTGQDGPNGSSVLYEAALVEVEGAGGAKRRAGLLLYAVNIGSVVHWVLFKTDGPELFNKHKKTVNQFLAGMKFVDVAPADDAGSAKDPAAKPKAKPQPKKPRAVEQAARGAGRA
jgi:hypothetical protein